MPRRLAAFVVFAAVLVLTGSSPLDAEEGAGARDLTLGREALARQDYALAVEHLERGVLTLDPVRDAELAADVWLQIGIAWLNALDHPEHALPAFVASAGSAADPSTAWLWASVTAEKLGRTEEALIYRARALSPQTSAPTMPTTPAPEPVEAPQEKPDAVQHFFGPEAAEEPAPAVKPADPPEEKKEKVDAFEYFFGEKEKDEPKAEGEEKPPAA